MKWQRRAGAQCCRSSLEGSWPARKSSITAKNPPDSLLYVDIASVGTGVIYDTVEYAFADAPGRARRRVAHGDTIWSCVRPNVLKPPAAVLGEFDRYVQPWLAQQEVLKKQIKVLKQARDALLPRLMSGSLAV